MNLTMDFRKVHLDYQLNEKSSRVCQSRLPDYSYPWPKIFEEVDNPTAKILFGEFGFEPHLCCLLWDLFNWEESAFHRFYLSLKFFINDDYLARGG